MSLFLDSEVHLKGGARPVASAWCAVDPILAVAASDNSLALYGEEVRGLQGRRAMFPAPRATMRCNLTHCAGLSPGVAVLRSAGRAVLGKD